MKLDKHWWRTLDGRLVPDGDIEARTLAYPTGTELQDVVAVALGFMDPPEPEEEPEGSGAQGAGETGEDEGAGEPGNGPQEPTPADDPNRAADGPPELAQPAEPQEPATPATAAPKQATRAADKAAKASPNK